MGSNPTACSYLDPLIKLQKKCVRAINIIKLFDTINTYLQNLNILKFEKLVIQRISLMMFKFNIGEVPKPISDLFMVNRFFHNHNTKSVGYLHTPQASYRTFSYIGTHFLESFVTKRVNQCFIFKI